VQVLAAASTLDKTLRPEERTETGVKIASTVGKMIGERALALGVKQVAFDRSGYKYHGRVKALADAARETGIEF
jgi:large subunit ribosomal protein L18